MSVDGAATVRTGASVEAIRIVVAGGAVDAGGTVVGRSSGTSPATLSETSASPENAAVDAKFRVIENSEVRAWKPSVSTKPFEPAKCSLPSQTTEKLAASDSEAIFVPNKARDTLNGDEGEYRRDSETISDRGTVSDFENSPLCTGSELRPKTSDLKIVLPSKAAVIVKSPES
jgi:hypothetical protein